jgi:hypothetical protein
MQATRTTTNTSSTMNNNTPIPSTMTVSLVKFRFRRVSLSSCSPWVAVGFSVMGEVVVTGGVGEGGGREEVDGRLSNVLQGGTS